MASTEPAAGGRTVIERIGIGDSDAVWPLSVEAGWNQNVADWRYMLDAGYGFGVRGGDGRWQATSLVLPLGAGLAWISMVLVTKARRREGLGTALLRKCIEEVRTSGAVAGLDATEQGRAIYLPMGFRDLYRISRWHLGRTIRTKVEPPKGITLRRCNRGDLLEPYDRPRSGMERSHLLAHLTLRQPSMAWLAQNSAGELTGFVLGREGRAAQSIGPVIADSEQIALALIARAVTSVSPPFILDVPQYHSTVQTWLEGEGAESSRFYMRMALGDAKGLEDPRHVFALAGPELG